MQACGCARRARSLGQQRCGSPGAAQPAQACLTPARSPAYRSSRSGRLRVRAALFEPPPFQPTKLSVQWLAGARSWATLPGAPPPLPGAPARRRYTLTHNDITGALSLSIGADFNSRQVQGFYTRILRDEITAEWLFPCGPPAPCARAGAGGPAGPAPAELHIYCHVSGEERWLAPPQLRNFIFRREMTLVLDTFSYADRDFLAAHPQLCAAKVYVHFQSDVQDLDLREYWGVLGDRSSWRRMPKGLITRLKLLLFGFPALPHSRPRRVLTAAQQQLAAEMAGGELQAPAPASAAAPAALAADAGGGGELPAAAREQWHPRAEAAGAPTRTVALSLAEQRQLHPHDALAAAVTAAEACAVEQAPPLQLSLQPVACNGNGARPASPGDDRRLQAQQAVPPELQLQQQPAEPAWQDFGCWVRLPQQPLPQQQQQPRRSEATVTVSSSSSAILLPVATLREPSQLQPSFAPQQPVVAQQLLSRSAVVMAAAGSSGAGARLGGPPAKQPQQQAAKQ